METPAGFGGAYEIEREIGRGGMATVYLAHDRKHGRRVAVKVLHAELAAVLGVERFLQEVHVTAGLQHPHILGLIDSGVFGDEAGEALRQRPYYVMPFVEGETLRARLERDGPLPLADAVRLAGEVAGALDYAHRHGVVHRDVKPENILLHDGRALVADFGVALALTNAGGQRMTQTGLSLGTPQYMSPEQATGEKAIGPRSDVYALGAVTYEMLVGEPPFTGPSVQAVVARLLADEPRSITSQRRSVPAHVEAAVLTALEKLPADRFATAAEFAAAIAGSAPSARVTGPRSAPGVARRGARAWQWLPWGVAAAALGAAAAVAAGARRGGGDPRVERFDIMLPDHGRWADQPGPTMALSADGTALVYNGRDSMGVQGMFVRRLDSPEPVRLRGGELGSYPFFSPDGRWVGMLHSNRIVRVPVGGGVPETICDAGGYVAETWLERDAVVFADDAGLKQCTLGGQVTTLLASGPGELFRYPHALPSDRGILFAVRRGNASRLAVLDLRRGERRDLGVLGSDPRYVGTGHVVFTSPDGALRAVAFDPRSFAARGDPFVVVGDPRVQDGGAKVAVSRSGTVVAAPDAVILTTLELVDRSGRAERLYPEPAEFAAPRIAPDGRRVAVSIGNRSVWIVDRAQRTLTRASFDSSGWRPFWSPDGARLGYVHVAGTLVDLRVVRADGSAPAEPLFTMPAYDIYHGLFTPDGRSLVLRTTGGPGSRDIWLATPGSSAAPRPLLATRIEEESPALSPDGRWLAYVSDESGRREVYVRPFPSMGARHTVSLSGGTEPVWSSRGDELFYRNAAQMIVAQVRTAPTFEVTRRTTLFTDRGYVLGSPYQEYDVTRDARHFVMVRSLAGPSRLSATLHLFDHLDRPR